MKDKIKFDIGGTVYWFSYDKYSFKISRGIIFGINVDKNEKIKYSIQSQDDDSTCIKYGTDEEVLTQNEIDSKLKKWMSKQ